MNKVCFLWIKRLFLLLAVVVAAATPGQAAGLFPPFPAVTKSMLFEQDTELQKILALAAPLKPSPDTQLDLGTAQRARVKGRYVAPKRSRGVYESIATALPLPASESVATVFTLPVVGCIEKISDASASGGDGRSTDAVMLRPSASSPGLGDELPRPVSGPDVRFVQPGDIIAIRDLAKQTIKKVFNPLIDELNRTNDLHIPLVSDGAIRAINGYNIALLPLHECLVVRDAATSEFQGFIVVRPEQTAPLSPEQRKLFNAYAGIMKERMLTPEEAVMLQARLPIKHDEIHIELLEIAPAGARKGIATMLMKSILQPLSEDKTLQVSLEVLANNHPAIALYKKLGFCNDAACYATWRETGYLRMTASVTDVLAKIRAQEVTRITAAAKGDS